MCFQPLLEKIADEMVNLYEDEIMRQKCDLKSESKNACVKLIRFKARKITIKIQ